MTARSERLAAAWDQMTARFETITGRKPTTKRDWNTIEAAVNRVLDR